jgi:putative transposase
MVKGLMEPIRSDRPKRRQIRLPAAVYGESGARVLVTFTVVDRKPVFTDPALAAACVELIQEQAGTDAIGVLAYCLMPDHVHLLVRVDGRVDVIQFVKSFKSRSTRMAWTHGHSGQLWQRSFHDHVLREIDDEREYLRYILANPARVGLVETWSDYPHSGSFEYEITDLS